MWMRCVVEPVDVVELFTYGQKKIEVAEVFDSQRAPLASLSNPSGCNLPFPLPT